MTFNSLFPLNGKKILFKRMTNPISNEEFGLGSQNNSALQMQLLAHVRALNSTK